MHRFVVPALVMAALTAAAPTLTPQRSGTTNRLQAVSPVSARVVWASGVGGTFTVTTDGGATWRAGVVPGAEALEFRDVQGVSERDAFLMSAGNGGDSRIYRTDDGGATWALQFQNRDPKAFYDCFAFWDATHAIVFSDAVGDRFPALRTEDGATWHDIGDRLPAAQPSAAFGVAYAPGGSTVVATGPRGAAVSRDEGRTWSRLEGVEGCWAVAFGDRRTGWLVGTEGRIVRIEL